MTRGTSDHDGPGWIMVDDTPPPRASGLPPDPPMAGAPITLGFVVLTKQVDGSWRDDWDGELHVEAHKGVIAFDEAQKAVGTANVRLGRVVDFFEGP